MWASHPVTGFQTFCLNVRAFTRRYGKIDLNLKTFWQNAVQWSSLIRVQWTAMFVCLHQLPWCQSGVKVVCNDAELLSFYVVRSVQANRTIAIVDIHFWLRWMQVYFSYFSNLMTLHLLIWLAVLLLSSWDDRMKSKVKINLTPHKLANAVKYLNYLFRQIIYFWLFFLIRFFFCP